MSLVVVDASVAVKWYLPESGEPLADRAVVLLDQFNRWISDRRLLAQAAHIKKEVVQASDNPVSVN